MKNIYYTYCYLDQRKRGHYSYSELGLSFLYKPFYIGKGHGRRFVDYKKGMVNLHLYNTISLIEKEINSKPLVLKIAENLSEKQAFKLERKCIEVIGRRYQNTGSLCNYNDGGEGNSNPSRRIRTKISKSVAEYHKNNPYTEERREKIRSWTLGNNFSKGKFSGDKNYWYGKDTSSFKNQHAKYSYIVVSPEKDIYYVLKGCLNMFCKDFNLGGWSISHSAKVFAKTGKIFVARRSRNKGWFAIRHLSNNSKDETIGDQQLSLLLHSIVEKFNDQLVGAYTQVSGNGEQPYYYKIDIGLKIWSSLNGNIKQRLKLVG